MTQPKIITVTLVTNDALLSRMSGKKGRMRSSSITSDREFKLLERILQSKEKIKNGMIF